ncbi:MAG: hypothetical protein AB7Q69_18825 [Gemmatimonadales bacterium]
MPHAMIPEVLRLLDQVAEDPGVRRLGVQSPRPGHAFLLGLDQLRRQLRDAQWTPIPENVLWDLGGLLELCPLDLVQARALLRAAEVRVQFWLDLLEDQAP